MGAAEPAAVPVARAGANLALLLAGPEEADEAGGEEADGQEEGEGDVGLELSARVAARRDVAPIEDVSAAVTDQLHHRLARTRHSRHHSAERRFSKG